MIKYKSLAEERPDLLKEWNYEKNDKLGLDPNKISAGVRTKVWWKCKHGHEWQATIVNRVKGTKCPICTNHQIVIGFNDLSTTHPALAEEWNFDKNGDLLPTMVSYGTGKKVWWKCKQGHEWQATINSRTNAAIGCPYCSGRLVLAGYNDLETLKPDLKTEWNYEKNGSLLPNMVSCGSGKKVWWKCNKGHEWKTSVSARVTGGRNHQGVGCPICSNKQILVGYNDLATVNPELLKEWNYDKNNKLGIYPNKVTAGSGIKVWWKCNKGHEWKTSISGRTGGNGCPVCANQIILEGYNDLATVKPDLAKEWNYEKNGNLLPTKIGFGSAKKVWWKCDKGHEWQAVIRDRYSGKGCPVCSNRKIITGYNDLVTLKPELAKEWNYEKNNTLLPSQVSIGSAKKVWWKCNKGHEWQATIGHRALSNTGCPECFADKQTSFAEQAIYYFLDMCFPGEVENRCKLEDKQGFIEADIYLPKLNIVIEYDGAYWHKNRQEKDLEKECRFKAMGMRFIRIAEHNRNKVIENYILYDFYKNQEENLTWAIRELFIMLDISPLFVNISAFRDKILEFSRKNEVNNSLAVVNPELAKEWNYEKNGKLLPTMFTCGSQEKVWWKCSKCGHEWQASVANRNKGRDCPLCKPYKISKSLSKVRANNSLQEKFPQVAKEWNYEKNGTLTPDNINFGSGRKVWWKCEKGHEWQAVISSRSSGVGCPVCSGHQVLVGYNDLGTTRPELVNEWNYEKNGNLLPSQVTCGSNKKVWWKCHVCGHEWQAVISSRRNGVGCPKCGKKRAALLHSTPKYGESLQDKCVDLAKEWNYEKNNGLLPLQFHWGSNKKVWWKCSVCSHEWQAVISSRTKQGTGCPKCSKIKAGKLHSMPKDGQSLQDKFPNLAIEWNYEKNDKLLPSQVTCSSNKKVWWKCSKCGYEWQATVNNRQRLGRGCPNCYRIKNKKTT